MPPLTNMSASGGLSMNLLNYSKNLIYAAGNTKNLPEYLSRFRILCPEYSSCAEEKKPWPLEDQENLFALLWNLHEGHTLSATLLPRKFPFTFQGHYQPVTKTQMHSHEYLELFYIVDGEYRQKILDNEFTFSRGELCLIDRNCLHQEVLDGTSATILFLGISPDIFDDISKSSSGAEGMPGFLNAALLKQKNVQQYLHFRPRPDTDSLMEETLFALLSELTRNDDATAIICRGLLLRIFSLLSTNYEFSLSKKAKKEMNWILLEEISAFIREHLQDISIRMLSERFHFQDDYFNRLLKNYTGKTYTEFLQSLRLERAETLLRETNISVEEIAREIGYHNKGYFYKISAERHRLTPAQFRRKMRK